MKRKTFFLFALFCVVTGVCGAGVDYLLKPPMPIPGVTTYSPVAGGFNGQPAYAFDMSETPIYRTESISVGMIASESASTSVVGSYLTPPSGFSVDWSKTVAEFAQSDAVTNGYAFYTALADPGQRFASSRCGSFTVKWISTGGQTNEVLYQAEAPTTVVPHRLYWTSQDEGFNGPVVSVPKNYGIRIFGNPELFWNESKVDGNGLPVYDNGVHYNRGTGVISAYAQSQETGPRGYFVVAYYDSGLCERMLGFTVVEVLPPEEVYLKTTVGAEVRPQNENYNPDSDFYMPVLQTSQNTASAGGATGSREPYFYYQQPIAGRYHAKAKRVYAISETAEGETGAKKAEIYWEASDDFNVFWPFELSCYTITWPDCPTVVVGSEKGAYGPGITFPSDYSATLLDWKWPENAKIASVSAVNNQVEVYAAGRFCLKLTNEAQDNFWLVPLRSALDTDSTAFPVATTLEWQIGYEVLPQLVRIADDDGRSAELLAAVDPDQGGYIYEPRSKGHNWNPNLYHATGASEKATSGDAAFADVQSTIHFVNVAAGQACDAEVWWMQSYQVADMPQPVVFPILPERYKAVWPEGQGVQDIVISSGKGSGTGGWRASGSSLFLPSVRAFGSLDFDFASAGSQEATVGFWFNAMPSSGETCHVQLTTGQVISVAIGLQSLDLSVVSKAVNGMCRCALTYGGGVLTNFTAAVGEWLPVYTRFKNGTVSVSMGDAFAPVAVSDGRFTLPDSTACSIAVGGKSGGAASGTALDGINVWNFALDDDFLLVAATNAMRETFSRAAVHIDFSEAAETALNEIFVLDENFYRAFTGSNLSLIAPGCPKWDDGLFAVSDGVTPRAYVQNVKDAWGYNPNEEHAFALQTADGRYALYALRNDMNDKDNKPYVLMEYAEEGRGAMRVFRVLDASEHYPWPTLTDTVGTKVTTLSPLDRMPSGLCPKSTTTKKDDQRGPVTYRDRTGALWARRAGSFDHSLYYYGEDGFICTAGNSNELAGVILPFLNRDNAYDWEKDCSRGGLRSAFDRDKLSGTKPTPIRHTAVWPSDPPTMSIAQVLTTAENGLPQIYDWKTAAVIYPTCINETDHSSRAVKLIDPTVARTAAIPLDRDFPGEYGFTLGSSGDCFLRQGKYYFTGLPPVVSERLYVDVNSAGAGKANLTLIGDQVSSATGTSYLRVNSLSTNDYESIKYFFENASASETRSCTHGTNNLVAALGRIFNAGDVEPSPQDTEFADTISVSYKAHDHYALVATGEGAGYVTLVQNDGDEAEGLPVSMQVINVGTNLYCGKIVTVTDANNTLSEQLNVLYTAPFGRSADNFHFEWYHADAPSNGHTPTVPSVASENPSASYPGGDGAWPTYDTQRSGVGKSCIEAVNPAAPSLNELVNRYWTLHYRAKKDTTAYRITSGRWSGWCEPALAEGWVQRVLNALTPFAQRTSDFYNNAADTSSAMTTQIGRPWQGDVALNNESLSSVGLMELYRTILNKAESMSVARAGSLSSDVSAAANKQLILAASRLADFNLLLGGEAYSDAKNPLIGSDDGTTFTGSVFAFANQVDSLLDEELALLRGRTSALSPLTSTYPCYNRLIWNYTKGMTQGELAYVNNYDILAKDGLDTAETAAALYPQGHGDAYGYYLSAVTEYYRLLRNPAFTWGEASMMEMLVADKIVNVDYEEEDKFAEASYRLAKTGVDVVDLTARKQWRDNASDIRSGYFGNPSVVNKVGMPQAMGYGETACRAGFGALCNWAVANSILPASATNAVRYFTDTSIACVTRQNCASLDSLASTVQTLEMKVNTVDAGLNPLGLSANAIPFDISPARLVGNNATGPVTQYAQIRERTVRALENCETALGYAERYGSQLAALREQENEQSIETEDQEREYNKQLIAIYGRPYSGDIGVGKFYEQGYDGPDLYHYMYMDLAEYGFTNNISSVSNCVWYYTVKSNLDKTNNWSYTTNDTTSMSFNLTSDGFIIKPADLTGTRASEGTIQAAYRDFLTAYVKVTLMRDEYDVYQKAWERVLREAAIAFGKQSQVYADVQRNNKHMSRCAISKGVNDCIAALCDFALNRLDLAFEFAASLQNSIVGMSCAIPDATICKTVSAGWSFGASGIWDGVKTLAQGASTISEQISAVASINATLAELDYTSYERNKATIDEIRTAAMNVYDRAGSLQTLYAEMLDAQQVFRTKVEEGLQVLRARQLMRQRAASKAVTARYRDMFARVELNNALSKFSTTFDIAQRYVYELAKVYDYETGLLTHDPTAGGAFLGAVIGTRALGAQSLTTDSSGTDDGLWGVVTRLDANWSVLEGRLGANNPMYEEKWHSLRYSNFRIDPSAAADAAWREELAKYWVDDIFADARVVRYCQPPAGGKGAKTAGLVIPFATSISAGENFFGQTLMGGEMQYSASAYATRILAAGVRLVGYDSLVVAGTDGLSADPQVYLVPTGFDYMRTPAGTSREIVSFDVVDQVLPLPYAIGSTELDDVDWVATLSGLDGTADAFATIRRHAQFPANGQLDASARLVGRSAWNDGWLLVIPANAMNGNVETAKKKFLSGAVTDIKIGLKTFTRQGN